MLDESKAAPSSGDLAAAPQPAREACDWEAVAVENAARVESMERLLQERTAALRLFSAELRELTTELEIINSVQQALARQLDFQSILELVGDTLRDLFGGASTFIALYDEASNLIETPYFVAADGHRVHAPPFELGQGLTSIVIQTRRPLVFGTFEEMLAHGAILEEPDKPQQEESWMAVPILVGDRAIGAVAMQDYAPHRYSDADARLLSTITASMGVALENARLFEETHRLLADAEQRAAEMAIVNRISQALVSELEPEALIQLAGEQLRQTFDADIVYVALLDPQTNLIHFPYQYGESFDTLRLGEGLTSRILQTGEPALINEDVAGRHTELGIESVGTPAQSYLGVPILLGGHAIGVISVQSTRQEGRFDEDDVGLLSTIAANVGVALHNAQLYQETGRRAEQFRAISEVGRRMLSLLPVDELLWEIAHLIKEALDYYLVGIALIEGNELVFRAGAGAVWETPDFQPPRVKIGRQGITGWVAESGEPLLVNDLSQESRYYSLPEASEMQSELAVPLKTKAGVIGVLHVQSDRLNAFDESDLVVLQSVAHQAAIAIENAHLFAEVRRQQQFSESLVEYVPVAIVTADADDRVRSWNPAAERLFDYSRQEAIGQVLVDLITSAETQGEAIRFLDYTLDRGHVHAVTQRCRRDGSPVDVELLAVPVSTSDGKPGLVAIYHDITELKEATRAIEESQRRLADIIAFLPDATLVVDREGRVIAWNRAMEEMTGVRAQEMLHKGNYEYALPFYGVRRPILIDLVLLPDEDLESQYAHIERQGATLLGEALVPVLRGEPAYLFAAASALRDSKGEIVGAIETIRDISDRKRVEEELRQAKAAAEAATQAKSTFLATMSHEIRTPMNAVIGMTSLLLDTPLTVEQRDFADTIRTSGDALLTIINDILDFSKIEAGRIELERQPFDVRECVESAVGLVAGQAAAKNLELGCWIDPQVPAGIAGDETRLRQVVLNLLSNAVKFTEQGEVLVSVSASAPTDSGLEGEYELHFAVRDTGLGIPVDRMDRLFQSFSQLDSSTTRRYGGTGLGLAISKRLTELMGGRMWAESAGIPGQGSTFHFTIVAQPAAVQSRVELDAEAPDLKGRRVLIVDDNRTNRRILTLQTQGWGLVTRDTGSPAEALDWVRRGEALDVAIVDWHMPEMDGMTLAAELGKLDDRLPVVMISSLGRADAEQSDRFAAFLVKPVRASQLYDALVGVLADRPEAQAPEPVQAASLFDAEMGKKHPLRILLAEDNAINQKLALRILERLGYRADVAGNGLEVIRTLERQTYDVVFMDVQMPEMDGLEATHQIVRRWSVGARPRIIAMTANALAEDREVCLAAGMDDYLAKPIRVDELVAALERSVQVSMAESDVIDRAAFGALLESVGSDLEFLDELLKIYLIDSPKLFERLHAAQAAGNADELRRAAHSLKSTSASVGAMILARTCEELEQMGKAGVLDGADAVISRAEEEYAMACRALKSLATG